jgi:lipopolysaccharide export system protein LptA
MWQGSNRIQAERIDIDRDEQKLIARGNVISQFVEKSTPANDAPVLNADPKVVPVKKVKSSGNRTIFTTIKAPELIYTDEDKLAYYKGGVVLKRPGMDVVSRELRAWLKDSESDSSLDHAFADGAVKIVQVSPDRTRTGTSERAEYYVGEEKVILKEGQPTLVDSVRGTTVGRQLTYFQGDDRLLVDGATAKPAVSNLKRK